MKTEIQEFLNNFDYDIRKSGNARWIDQKCTPDVISIISDCVFNFVNENGNIRFNSRDIWDYEYTEKTVKEIFQKPSTKSSLSQNEYDKFFSQPLEMLSYSQVLVKTRINNRNYYEVGNIDILEYLSFGARTSLEFLNLYIRKVLGDSSIWYLFDSFFKIQSQNEFLRMKVGFEDFTIEFTKINSRLEPRRIFTKILNPIAFKESKCGTIRGRMSKFPISYDALMYNRANFRDMWNDKPKNITRQEWVTKIKSEINPAFYSYQSNKAKQFIKNYNEVHRNGLSELNDEYSQGKGTQVHHIFPESEFPTISGHLENLIVLTPTQHLYKAHPNNNTSRIDVEYQEILLKAKAGIIDENINTSSQIYTFENFSEVLNTGFYHDEYIEIKDYIESMLCIQNYYDNYRARRHKS